MIELDYKKDKELFNETAKEWADKIGAGVTNTQIRKFYDQILELNNQAKKSEDFGGEILPFVKMLNSKVAYNSGRTKLVNEAFVNMMNQCINQVDTKEKLQIFKLFFEAVIGFHKSLEGRH